MSRLSCRPLWIVSLGIVAVLLALPHPAYAATFIVNSTADIVDANPGDGVCATAGAACTLRAAIQEANALAGADTITLPAGTYILTIAGSGEDASATGDLDITGDLTINGAGNSVTTINGNALDRVFESRPAAGATVNVTISGVTITNGNVTGIGFVGAAFGDRGATTGITNLTMTDVVINANTCGNNGGGIALVRNAGATGNPSLTLVRSAISNNSAVNGGGIYCSGCTLNINYSSIISNTVTTVGGGIGIAGNTANITVAHSTISGNTANSNGGGVGKSFGTGTVLINFSTVTNNTAVGNGGGIYANSGATIQNSIVQGNTAGSTATANDCNSSTSVSSAGYNVVGSGTGCPSGGINDTTSAANLGGLQVNGTVLYWLFTHLPGSGSAASERVPNGSSGCVGGVTVDERGGVRADGLSRGGSACDSGAVETDTLQTPSAIALSSFVAQRIYPNTLTVAGFLVALTAFFTILWHKKVVEKRLP